MAGVLSPYGCQRRDSYGAIKKKKKRKRKRKRENRKKREEGNNKRGEALSRRRPIVATLDHIAQLNLLFYAWRTCVTCTRNHRVYLKGSFTKKKRKELDTLSALRLRISPFCRYCC